jgi:hypothetical protein
MQPGTHPQPCMQHAASHGAPRTRARAARARRPPRSRAPDLDSWQSQVDLTRSPKRTSQW